MEKKRVEIVDLRNNVVYDRLLLTEEQTRLLIYLIEAKYFENYMGYDILKEDYEFKEI